MTYITEDEKEMYDNPRGTCNDSRHHIVNGFCLSCLKESDVEYEPSVKVIKSNIRPNVKHYQQGTIEPIDYINSHDFNFNLGNAIKYITRCNFKGSKRQDLEKAIDYINFELERIDND